MRRTTRIFASSIIISSSRSVDLISVSSSCRSLLSISSSFRSCSSSLLIPHEIYYSRSPFAHKKLLSTVHPTSVHYPSILNININISRAFASTNNQNNNMQENLLPQEGELFKPALPSKLLNETGLKIKEKLFEDIHIVEKELSVDLDERDAFFRLSRKLNVQTHEILQHLRNGNLEQYNLMIVDVDQSIAKLLEMIKNDIVERESKLSFNFEKVFILKLLFHFYQTGKLAPLSSFQSPCPTDTEYIGAVIGFCQELSRYTINRACSLDFPSVKLSKEMIIEIYQILLEFDFRNGPLRRKFDGVKYALKAIENIFYELNLQNNIKEGVMPVLPPPTPSFSTGDELDQQGPQQQQPPVKKARVEKGSSTTTTAETNIIDSIAVPTQPPAKRFIFLSEEEFRGVIQRMAEYDQAREFIIKESRDIQKAAKQAIYAVIRNQLEDSRNKLNLCKKKAEKLITDVVTKYPTLRQGSFSNSLEEYSEGELLYHWVKSNQLITKTDLSFLTIHEYVNGLADFTGEIGRLAVMYASERQIAPVQVIQQLDIVIYDYITKLNILNNNSYFKKMDMISMNAKKVDDIIYEMTMLQMNGKVYRLMPNNEPMPGASEKNNSNSNNNNNNTTDDTDF